MNNLVGKGTFLIFFILGLYSLAWPAEWRVMNIKGLFTISLPGEPRVSDAVDMRNYVLQSDSNSFLIQVKQLKKNVNIADSATLEAFYQGAVKGITRGTKASLIGSKAIRINGFSGQEMEFIKGGDSLPPVYSIARIFLIKSNMVVFSFSAPYSVFERQKTLSAHFLNSFRAVAGTKVWQFTDSADMVRTTASSNSAPVPPQDLPANLHTELVKPNTMYFVMSFTGAILLLSALLFFSVRLIKSRQK